MEIVYKSLIETNSEKYTILLPYTHSQKLSKNNEPVKKDTIKIIEKMKLSHSFYKAIIKLKNEFKSHTLTLKILPTQF